MAPLFGIDGFARWSSRHRRGHGLLLAVLVCAAMLVGTAPARSAWQSMPGQGECLDVGEDREERQQRVVLRRVRLVAEGAIRAGGPPAGHSVAASPAIVERLAAPGRGSAPPPLIRAPPVA